MNLNEQDPQPVQQEYRITLTQDQFALVDAEDYERLNQFKWNAVWCKRTQTYYAYRTSYVEKKRTLLMHREVMNAQKGSNIDHENRDTLDNRRRNLRFATHGQNACNRTKRRGSTGIFKGVSWHNATKKWQARICVDRKQKHLGVYDTPEEAFEIYKKAAVELHGEFAKW